MEQHRLSTQVKHEPFDKQEVPKPSPVRPAPRAGAKKRGYSDMEGVQVVDAPSKASDRSSSGRSMTGPPPKKPAASPAAAAAAAAAGHRRKSLVVDEPPRKTPRPSAESFWPKEPQDDRTKGLDLGGEPDFLKLDFQSVLADSVTPKPLHDDEDDAVVDLMLLQKQFEVLSAVHIALLPCSRWRFKRSATPLL